MKKLLLLTLLITFSGIYTYALDVHNEPTIEQSSDVDIERCDEAECVDVTPEGHLKLKRKVRMRNGRTRTVTRTLRLLGVKIADIGNDPHDARRYQERSVEYITDMAIDRYVYIAFDQAAKDEFDNMLGYVYFEDGRCLNAMVVFNGYGLASDTYPCKFYQEFSFLANMAMGYRKGIWPGLLASYAGEGSGGGYRGSEWEGLDMNLGQRPRSQHRNQPRRNTPRSQPANDDFVPLYGGNDQIDGDYEVIDQYDYTPSSRRDNNQPRARRPRSRDDRYSNARRRGNPEYGDNQRYYQGEHDDEGYYQGEHDDEGYYQGEHDDEGYYQGEYDDEGYYEGEYDDEGYYEGEYDDEGYYEDEESYY